MAHFEAVVSFRIADLEVIRKIQEHFGMPPKMTVNRECPVVLDDDEKVEMLREVEKRGFIYIVKREIFEFPKV